MPAFDMYSKPVTTQVGRSVLKLFFYVCDTVIHFASSQSPIPLECGASVNMF